MKYWNVLPLFMSVLLVSCEGCYTAACNQEENVAGGGPGPGGGGGSNTPCVSLKQSNGTVTFSADANCAGCSITDAPAVADGDFSAAASVLLASSTPAGTLSVKAEAQSGVVFAAGSVPSFRYAAATGTLCRVVTTYLDGQPQEASSQFCFNEQAGSGYEELDTTLPFDAVQVSLSSGQPNGDVTVNVTEICSDLSP